MQYGSSPDERGRSLLVLSRRRGAPMNMGSAPNFTRRSLSAFYCPNVRGRESGAALVLVLLLTAVLTALVTLFLSTTGKYVSVSTSALEGERADQMLEVAWKQIVTNLGNEMVAGSQNPAAPEVSPFVAYVTPEGTGRLMFPANARASVPSRNAPENQPNLVKFSSRDAAFFNADHAPETFPWAKIVPPALPAAPVSSEEPSKNRIFVSSDRWKLSGLLSPGVPQPVPDWYLLTGGGEKRLNLLTNEANPIVARYAFMIFDEGGLADLSVAGFLSKASSALIGGKGTPHFLDLRSLLRDAGMSGPQAVAFNDALISWRDEGSLKRPGYPLDLLRVPFGIPGRTFSGNRQWTGRVGLTRMVRNHRSGPPDARENFLQYVGTFSRSLEQPSLAPLQAGRFGSSPPLIRHPSEGGNDGAGWDADSRHRNPLTRLSPPFLQVRVLTPFTRGEGERARVGEPLVNRRFPLTRLALVGHRSVAKEGSEIESFFGLTRESFHKPWIYRNGASRILTLHEVSLLPAGRAREPDFIEMLKAAIQGGVLAPNNPSMHEDWETSLDIAVIQIAANLIDQYDADDFPTPISFAPEDGGRILRGIEDLPYFQGVRTCVSTLQPENPFEPFVPAEGQAPVIFKRGVGSRERKDTLIWQKVYLWNPHRLSKLGGDGKTSKLVRLFVTCDTSFSVSARQVAPMKDGATVVPEIASLPNAEGLKPDGEQFRVLLEASDRDAFYKPVPVGISDDPRSPRVQRGESNTLPAGVTRDSVGNLVFGVGIADLFRAFSATVGTRTYSVLPSSFLIEAPPLITYRLEYLEEGSVPGESETWVAYDEKKVPLVQEIPIGAFDWQYEGPLNIFPDPRTCRLGPVLQQEGQTAEELLSTYFVNAGDSVSDYADADGVIRRGMGAAVPGFSPLDEVARPRLLNRPFRNVGEIAFASSGNPWKQLDLSTTESGYAGLLDIFAVSSLELPSPLAAGRINLNTRQFPVLKAALNEASRSCETDESDPLLTAEVESLAAALLEESKRQPLRNLSELVGRWKGGAASGVGVIGSRVYDGFAAKITPSLVGEPARQSAVRALADMGDTKVWNLFIDVIVQTGRYPRMGLGPMKGKGVAGLNAFVVEGERRAWVHVALDRLTGQLLDSQVEFPIE